MKANLPTKSLTIRSGLVLSIMMILSVSLTAQTIPLRFNNVPRHLTRVHPKASMLTHCYNVQTATLAPISLLVPDANAVYSNIDVNNYSGFFYGNALAVDDGSGIAQTSLVADDIEPAGTPPYQIDKIRFTMFNGGTNDVSVRPCIRFYAYDGTTFLPSTLVAAYTFNPITIAAGSGSLITGTITPFVYNDVLLWAGIFFDNDGGSTATVDDLNNFGPGIWDFAGDVGQSQDIFFQSDAGNDQFLTDNPTGAGYNFGGPPMANFGWELVQDVPLPITIQYLHGTRNGNTHNLSWKIASTNLTNVDMTLERSSNNRDYTSIYTTHAPSTNFTTPFTYADAQPLSGINYYRIKISDADGKKSYSSIVALLNKTNGFELINISPNPSTGNKAMLNIASASAENLKLVVVDMSGRKISEQSASVIAGNSQIEVNISNLAKGRYHIIAYSQDGTSKSVGFIRQ